MLDSLVQLIDNVGKDNSVVIPWSFSLLKAWNVLRQYPTGVTKSIVNTEVQLCWSQERKHCKLQQQLSKRVPLDVLLKASSETSTRSSCLELEVISSELSSDETSCILWLRDAPEIDDDDQDNDEQDDIIIGGNNASQTNEHRPHRNAHAAAFTASSSSSSSSSSQQRRLRNMDGSLSSGNNNTATGIGDSRLKHHLHQRFVDLAKGSIMRPGRRIRMTDLRWADIADSRSLLPTDSVIFLMKRRDEMDDCFLQSLLHDGNEIWSNREESGEPRCAWGKITNISGTKWDKLKKYATVTMKKEAKTLYLVLFDGQTQMCSLFSVGDFVYMDNPYVPSANSQLDYPSELQQIISTDSSSVVEYGSNSTIYLSPQNKRPNSATISSAPSSQIASSPSSIISCPIPSFSSSPPASVSQDLQQQQQQQPTDCSYALPRLRIRDLKAGMSNITLVAVIRRITISPGPSTAPSSHQQRSHICLTLGDEDDNKSISVVLRNEAETAARRLKVGQPVIVHNLCTIRRASGHIAAICGEHKDSFIQSVTDLDCILKSVSLFPQSFISQVGLHSLSSSQSSWIIRGVITNLQPNIEDLEKEQFCSQGGVVWTHSQCGNIIESRGGMCETCCVPVRSAATSVDEIADPGRYDLQFRFHLDDGTGALGLVCSGRAARSLNAAVTGELLSFPRDAASQVNAFRKLQAFVVGSEYTMMVCSDSSCRTGFRADAIAPTQANTQLSHELSREISASKRARNINATN